MKTNIVEFQNVKDHNSLGKYIPGVVSCIQSAFDGKIEADDAYSHMSGDQVLVAVRSGFGVAESVFGFSATSLIAPCDAFRRDELSTEKGMYFAGAAIHESAQGTGLYRVLNDYRIAYALNFGVNFVFTRTQNPRVQQGISHALDVYIQKGLISSYEITNILSQGAYGKMLTGDVPVARGLKFDDINYHLGDAKIITWSFDK